MSNISNNFVINYENMKLLMNQLNNHNNDIRKSAEEFVFTLKYNLDTYAMFLAISQKEVEKNLKIQPLLIIKSLLKEILNISSDKYRAKIAFLDQNNKGINYTIVNIPLNYKQLYCTFSYKTLFILILLFR